MRSRIYHTQNELIGKAQRDWWLRADFVAEDVVLLLLANAAIVRAVGGQLPETSPRFAALALDALGAVGAAALPPLPSDELFEVLQRPAVIQRKPAADDDGS